jgi:hypothetical protein
MSQKAKKNKGPLGFPAPFGYTYLDGNLAIDQGEASVVRAIFERYDDAWTLSNIADWLNENGIKGKNGALWQKATVRGVLTNPMYRGEIVWDSIRQPWPQGMIITPERFSDTQMILRSRMRSPGKPKKKRRQQHA